jgi:putative oxidoreductase
MGMFRGDAPRRALENEKPMRSNVVAGKTENVILWVLQIATALIFLVVGGFEMIGAPETVELFERIGIGQWFRYTAGALQIAGAIVLLIPALAAWGALLLAVVMAGAVCTQAFVLGNNPVIPAVLLVVTGGIAWARLRSRARENSRSQTA